MVSHVAFRGHVLHLGIDDYYVVRCIYIIPFHTIGVIRSIKSYMKIEW